MRDLRLLAPAAIAWATAWCVVAAPDAGIDAVPVAWAILTAGGALIGALLIAPRPTGEWTPTAVRMRSVAVGLVVVAAAAGLVSSSAALELRDRAGSALAGPADSRQVVDVVVDVVSAPRPMRAPAWGDAGDAPSFRVDAQLVAVDGRQARAVPVTTTVAVPVEMLAIGSRLGFAARVSPLPAADQSAFRLAVEGEVAVVARPPAWLGWAVGLGSGLAVAASGLGGDGGALVPGLAIGDTTRVGAELEAAMRASSLARI